MCSTIYLNIRGEHLITAIGGYRMSSHELNKERGRYNNSITQINQRICTRCESSEIDDEIHLHLQREILFNSVATITCINMQPTNDMFSRKYDI